MRLFIAININTDTRMRLAALREELRSRSRRGNFSHDENLHLTLAFLGECDAKQLAAAKGAMDDLRIEPFSIVIDRVGRFKGADGDLWWAGLEENRPLLRLQQDLTQRLSKGGFLLESRKYSPHITLGRQVQTDSKAWDIEPFGEEVTAIELMKSERIGGKLTYMALGVKAFTWQW